MVDNFLSMHENPGSILSPEMSKRNCGRKERKLSPRSLIVLDLVSQDVIIPTAIAIIF